MTRRHLLKMRYAWSRHMVLHTRGHLLAMLRRDMDRMSGMVSISVRLNGIINPGPPISVTFKV